MTTRIHDERTYSLFLLLWLRRLAIELGDVDAAALLFFDQLQPRFQSIHAPQKLRQELWCTIGRYELRDGGIAQLPVQRGKEQQRILAAVGHRDAALFLAEEHRRFRPRLFAALTAA